MTWEHAFMLACGIISTLSIGLAGIVWGKITKTSDDLTHYKLTQAERGVITRQELDDRLDRLEEDIGERLDEFKVELTKRLDAISRWIGAQNGLPELHRP